MGIWITMERYNYEETRQAIINLTKPRNEDIIDKILLEFGNKIGNDYIVLCDEYYEEHNASWNLGTFIEKYFHLEEGAIDFALKSKPMVDHRSIDEACENLGIKYEDLWFKDEEEEDG